MIKSIEKKIKKVNQLLIEKYGIPPRPDIPPDPVDMLIATILSQNTNDKNSYKAFQKLKEKFKTWDEAARQPRQRIESLIKVAGLGKQKSAAIKNFLTSVLKEKGKISLDFLKDKSDDEILEELTHFGGVGVKTASCVLQFSLRRNICPVDTHVHRTTNRIGIVNTSSPDKSFVILKENMPKGIAHSFHTNLIRLGREICRPAVPVCSACPLVKVCEYEYKNLDKVPVYKENKFMLLDSIE
ncbi:MAG: endonuclease III [Ignavibacteriaceae bacterium]